MIQTIQSNPRAFSQQRHACLCFALFERVERPLLCRVAIADHNLLGTASNSPGTQRSQYNYEVSNMRRKHAVYKLDKDGMVLRHIPFTPTFNDKRVHT